MDRISYLRGANQRAMGACGEGDARDSGDPRDRQCVARHLLDRLVAVHRRHRDQLDLGIPVGKDQRDRIVVPRVAIQNDLVRHWVRLAAGGTR